MSDWHNKRLGKYQVKALLGRGAMADIYQAFQPILERNVAIKVIHPHLADDSSFVDRFRREARVVAALRHPGIVQVYDFEVEGDIFYMVMEFVPGESLKEHLARIRERGQWLPLDAALRLFKKVVEAVSYAHKQGIVHRDLKPDNVLLAADNQPILADFGLSRIIGAERLAEAGAIIGTPIYMSPEQGEGEVGDERSDIYSLGVMLYELATGIPPFSDGSAISIILKHLDEPLPLPRLINADLPGPVEQIIQKALEKNPDNRFQSAQALLDALEVITLSPTLPDEDSPANDLDCPYRGLQVFDTEHAEFYFGREILINQLIEKLKPEEDSQAATTRSARFLAVIGASGSGKSSLVRAGLIPALQKGAVPGSDYWAVRIMKPGSQPLAELAALLAPLIAGRSKSLDNDRGRLFNAFMTNGRTLHLIMQRAWVDRCPEQRLVLVVDQFEEIFTICHSEAERARFIENLLYAARVNRGRIIVIVTMRADFYHRCAIYRDLANRISAQQVLVGPMYEPELRRAIELPAQRVGMRFEPGLVDTILSEVAQQPGALPLLQHALLELWERRQGRLLTLQGYRVSAGVTGAIAQRAEDIYSGFNSEEQAAVRRVMLRLTQPGEGTEDTRRRARKRELLPGSGTQQIKATEQILQQLVDARLITTSRDMVNNEELVDVSHEALIRGWARLRQWLDEDRMALRIHRQLSEAAETWKQNNGDTSYLYRGGRLAQAEEWAEIYPADLNALEQAFLEASRIAVEVVEQEREAARQRELAQARALAEAAQARANALAEAEQERDRAQHQMILARSRELAAQSIIQLNINQELAILLAIEAGRLADGAAVYDAIRHYFALGGRPIHILAGHNDTVMGLDWHPDGTRIVTGGFDGTARIWDAEYGKELAILKGHSGPVFQANWNGTGTRLVTAGRGGNVRVWRPVVASNGDSDRWIEAINLNGHTDDAWCANWNPTGTHVVTAGPDGTARVWDTRSGDQVAIFDRHTDQIRYADWSPDGRNIVTCGDDHIARVWHAKTGAEIVVLTGHSATVFRVRWNPDGTQVVTAGFDKTARIWDTRTGIQQRLLAGHTDTVLDVGWDKNGELIVTASEDGTARVWDAESGMGLVVLTGHTAGVFRAVWDVSGERIVTTSRDGTVRVWNVFSGSQIALLSGHTDWVWPVKWSRDGERLATGSFDGTARVWDVKGGTELVNLAGHMGGLRCAIWNETGTHIVTAGEDGTARIWDAETGIEQALLSGHAEAVLHAAWNRAGTHLVTAGRDGTARVWDFEAGTHSTIYTHNAEVLYVAWNADGERVATASADGSAQIWNVHTGAELSVRGIHRDTVNQAVWDNVGDRIVTASDDGTARVWDVTNETQLVLLSGHRGPVFYAAWNNACTQIVTASKDGTARVWDAERGLELTCFIGHTGQVLQATWNPVGTCIATAGEDGTIRVWDAKTGAELIVLSGHGDRVRCIDWNPAGTRLVSASDDGTARIWDAERGEQLALLKEHTAVVLQAMWDCRGERIVTANADGSARIWETKSGTEMFVLACPADEGLRQMWDGSQVRLITARNSPAQIYYVSKEDLLNTACQHAVRNMTEAEWKRYIGFESYRKTCSNL